MATNNIEFYGAQWCGDCRRAKKVLDSMGTSYTYHDLESEDGAAEKAFEISGQKHIPVIQFPDGSFLVEPSNDEVTSKVEALGLR
ncbi:NrdH-redoxin [Arcanobacterium haemolyticum]|nr:NrdH-redoxin [Arcanobacterium haemolyticum]